MSNKKELFNLTVTISGKAGSGKSTLAGFITQQLQSKNLNVTLVDPDTVTYADRAKNIWNLTNCSVRIVTKNKRV